MSNFPNNLDITPSVGLSAESVFGVTSQQKSIEKYGIAGRVWEAAYALSLYIRGSSDSEFDPSFHTSWQSRHCCTVLELGSGTGIIGSCIAKAVAWPGRDLVIVTDLPDVCPLLEANLFRDHQIHSGVLFVRPLPWGDPEYTTNLASELLSLGSKSQPRLLTHIVCSDLVYFPELFGPLLRSLLQLSSPPFVSSTPVDLLIAYRIRSLTKESSFWSAFGLWFSFEPVSVKQKCSPRRSQQPDGRHAFTEDTYIFTARRRPESFAWMVPQSDQALMSGVGACGTNVPKADDTFETLLLMAVGEDILA